MWALFGVNFRLLQEKAIMEGGQIFDTGPFSCQMSPEISRGNRCEHTVVSRIKYTAL